MLFCLMPSARVGVICQIGASFGGVGESGKSGLARSLKCPLLCCLCYRLWSLHPLVVGSLNPLKFDVFLCRNYPSKCVKIWYVYAKKYGTFQALLLGNVRVIFRQFREVKIIRLCCCGFSIFLSGLYLFRIVLEIFFARFGGLQLATVVRVMAFAHVWVQIYLACAWKKLLVVCKKNATFVAISIYVCERACICVWNTRQKFARQKM